MKSKEKKCYAFLFNDLLIITHTKSQINKYRLKKMIPLLEGTTIDQVRGGDEGTSSHRKHVSKQSLFSLQSQSYAFLITFFGSVSG
jgi:hypothetical protein